MPAYINGTCRLQPTAASWQRLLRRVLVRGPPLTGRSPNLSCMLMPTALMLQLAAGLRSLRHGRQLTGRVCDPVR